MSGSRSIEQFLSGSPQKKLIKYELVIYPTKYNGNGDGQNFYSWMRILSYEVGHFEKKEIRLIQTNNSWWNSSTKNYTDYLKKSLKVDS